MSRELVGSVSSYHTQHVPALDGMRGWAAILVTFYHAILHLDEKAIYSVLYPAVDKVAISDILLKLVLIVFNGSTAVLLFYVLSGTVLCQSLLRDKSGIKSVLLFLLRRILRLFPALFLCMFVMWALSAALQKIGVTFPIVSVERAISNALLIDTSLHGPSTSIQIEALATPFILFFAFVYRKSSVVQAVAIFTLSIMAIQKPELVFSLQNMHANTFVFIAGMVVALPEVRTFFERVTTMQLCFLLVCAFLFRHLVHFESLPGLIAQVLLLATLVGFVRWTPVKTEFHAFLESPISQFFGKISYSYYLLNVPVLWVIWFIPSFYEPFAKGGPVVGGLLSGVLATIMTIPFAYLSWKYVERYFIKLGVKITHFFIASREVNR
ncbi:acyltransferase family protein [Laribacter hongkongensis]|uniref:acyltransferase family protein n=1 Tax=Laribacter hongkongensis TaxID=168471 RepID=UPI001EFEC8BF|nr:acyltransferase [Laribacter hongkongensis]MCG9082782.1 acyltransferase [Laribacter hongkongensis]